MRRAQIAVVLAAFGVATLLSAALVLRYLFPKTEPPAWANEYDVTAVEPEAIAPGTEIGTGAPDGWSHLIIKSLPRVKPSEAAKVPSPPFVGRDRLIRQVSWMFTAFTADVVKEQQGSHTRYRLRAIGLGLGANVNGRDIVLTTESAKELGVNLEWFEVITLETGYRVQKQSRVVVHAPSFAIVDTPVTFRSSGKNLMLRFRYALLVDSSTGRLDVFCWLLGGENGNGADLTRAVLLQPNCIDPAELTPDLDHFPGNIPNELAFGVDDLPPHRLEVTIPEEARTLAGETRFSAESASELEAALRKLLPR